MWCSDDTSTDGGADATSEGAVDICDINAFIASGGNGHSCPKASSALCFPVCEAGDPGGCVCTEMAGGPIWVCTNPDDCHVPCSNTSPLNDADCDANDGGFEFDADDGSVTDASDAATDAGDAGDASDAASE